MKPKVKNAEGNETQQNADNNVNSQKEKQNLVTEGQALAQALKDYENPSKTLTPKKEHHPFSWWLKWASSIILIFAMIMTTHNLYPYNMFLTVQFKDGYTIYDANYFAFGPPDVKVLDFQAAKERYKREAQENE